MKCICGYSTSDKFPIYMRRQQIMPGIEKVDYYDDLFVCPSCGTLKVGNIEEGKSHGNADND